MRTDGGGDALFLFDGQTAKGGDERGWVEVSDRQLLVGHQKATVFMCRCIC